MAIRYQLTCFISIFSKFERVRVHLFETSDILLRQAGPFNNHHLTSDLDTINAEHC